MFHINLNAPMDLIMKVTDRRKPPRDFFHALPGTLHVSMVVACAWLLNFTKLQVQICGEDIESSLSSVFEAMGYCPQHDALWPSITVAEHIAGYAEIRGIRQDQIQWREITPFTNYLHYP